MANESRERFKERKYLYKLKHKLEKEKKDNNCMHSSYSNYYNFVNSSTRI